MADVISTESLIVARFITGRAIHYFRDLPMSDSEFIGKLRVCEFEIQSELDRRSDEIEAKSNTAMFSDERS